MIHVGIVRDQTGFIRQFSVKGHAGYARRGRDIICAAASVTAYTAVGALEDLAGLRNIHTERDGFLTCSIPADITVQQKQVARVILDTTAIGFRQIELEYPEFLSVVEEEV